MATTKNRPPPGTGRKPGSKNRRTKAAEELRDKALAGGRSPLEFMLSVMRDPRAKRGWSPADWMRLRCDMAKAAAPYLHPRLVTQRVEMGGPGGGDIPVRHSGVLVAPAQQSPAEWFAAHGSGLDPVDDGSDGD